MLALYTLAASFLLPSRLQAPVPAAAHRTPQPRAAADECVVFSTLAQRRSVAKYDSSKPVPANVVTAALEAAILAPNHFLTEPWRFYQCGPETVAKLCALNEDKRAMFEGVPGWIVVTVATEYDDAGLISTKKGLEDHAAVSCAIQNMMLSFSDDGIGSKWMTGALGIAPEDILGAVGADAAAERFMGAVWYGYPAKPLDPESKARRCALARPGRAVAASSPFIRHVRRAYLRSHATPASA